MLGLGLTFTSLFSRGICQEYEMIEERKSVKDWTYLSFLIITFMGLIVSLLDFVII
jgi:hypothetical protein